jgi:uncharacterized membrane protein
MREVFELICLDNAELSITPTRVQYRLEPAAPTQNRSISQSDFYIRHGLLYTNSNIRKMYIPTQGVEFQNYECRQ